MNISTELLQQNISKTRLGKLYNVKSSCNIDVKHSVSDECSRQSANSCENSNWCMLAQKLQAWLRQEQMLVE